MSLFYTSVMENIMTQLRAQNQGLPASVLPSDIRLTLLKTVTNHSSGKNTRAVVTVGEGERVRGFKPIYYNRVNLGTVLRNISFPLPKGAALRTHDLIPLLNARYGLGLTVNDVYDAPLPAIDAVVGITLQAKPKSIVWTGSAVIFLNSTTAVPNRVPQTTGVVNLGQLEKGGSVVLTPEMLLQGTTDPDGDALSVSFVQTTSGNGTLAGTGPWTVSATTTGTLGLTYVISDGRGGSVTQYATLEVVEGSGNTELLPFTFQLIPTLAGRLDSELPLGDPGPDLIVTGNFTQGSLFTVESPTLAFVGGMPERQAYNDYTTATIGDQAQTLAELGSWDYGHFDNGKYAPGGMNGRPAVYYYNHEDGGRIVRRSVRHTPRFGELFCASSLRVPPGKALGAANQHWTNSTPIPGVINGRSQLKMFWANVDDGGGEPADLIMPTLVSKVWDYGGNSHALDAWGSVGIDAESTWDWDSWNFFRCWAKHNPAAWDAGTMELNIVSARGNVKRAMVGPVLNNEATAPLFNEVAFGKWTEGNSLTQILNGDVYIAIGENAPCRVEIGDKPIYDRCSSLALCPPVEWSEANKKMTGRYTNGDLLPGRPQYVYVFNKHNQLLSQYGKLVNYRQPTVISGGDETLSWRANLLANGYEIIIETNGAYNFGTGPTEVASLGFGEDYLYNTALNTILQDGQQAGPLYVAEGGARRIEVKDGVRVLASRLRDPTAWSGEQHAGRILSYELDPPLGPNEKIATFQLYKIDYDGVPLNWQFKSIRFLSGLSRLDNNTFNEGYLRGSREHTNAMLSWDAAGGTSNTDIVHPHVNYGWCYYGVMLDSGSINATDGRIITHMNRHDGGRYLESAEDNLMMIDGDSANRVNWISWQDYIDGTNFSPEQIAEGAYEPTNIDLALTDILVQRGSFAHAVLASGPNPATSERQVVLLPKFWSANRLRLHFWQSVTTFPVKYIFIYNDEGQLVCTIHLEGTYVSPPWDMMTDTKGLVRKAGSNDSARAIRLNNLMATSNNQRWVFVAKPSTLATTLGVCGYFVTGTDVTRVLAFYQDGSIGLRMPGMPSLVMIRPAGTHLLSTSNRSVIELECINGTSIVVKVDGVEAGRYDGAGLALQVNLLMQSGVSNSGFVGTMYNAQYYEGATLRHRFKLEEGTGVQVSDDINGATGTVGTSLSWEL